MRTTVTLDDDNYEAAGKLSKTSGVPLEKVLSDMVRRGLRSAAFKRKESGWPVFDIPPLTPMVSVAHVQKLLDEEGIF